MSLRATRSGVSSESGTRADANTVLVILTGDETLQVSGSAGTGAVTGNVSVAIVLIVVFYLGDRWWHFHVQLALSINIL